MPGSTPEIKVRSEEIHEILSHMPHWIIRWGITLLFTLLSMLLLFAWLLKYPDTVQGKVILTTQTAPVRLVSQTNGTLERVYVADGTWVDQGVLVAKMTNPISEHALAYLQEFIYEIQKSLDGHATKCQASTSTAARDHIFGDIQGDYNNLCSLYQDYERLAKSAYHKKKLQGISTQVENHNDLASMIKQQLVYLERELAYEKEKYDAYRKIYAEKGMAKFDFFDKEAHYLEQQQALEKQKQELVKNAILTQEYDLRLQELSHTHAEKLRTLKVAMYASIQSIKNRIQQWQQCYTLTAPLAGTINHLYTFSAKHPVKSGEALFALVPKEEQYIAYMQVPSRGYGEIKPGHKARIKLTPYPYQEYGYLPATVKELALLPNKGQYSVVLQVDKGLVSTYGKVLSFKPEMDGDAEIITEDISFLQRIMHKFLGLSKPSIKQPSFESGS
jgi:multidrug resistance efflux pump